MIIISFQHSLKDERIGIVIGQDFGWIEYELYLAPSPVPLNHVATSRLDVAAPPSPIPLLHDPTPISHLISYSRPTKLPSPLIHS